MHKNCAISIPKIRGKISKQTTKSGIYIHYILGRTYDPKTKLTKPDRVLIGKQIPNTDTMVPNENFSKYFPNAVFPEIRETAERSGTLSIGVFIVMRQIVKDYGLDAMLKKYFRDKTGLVLDFAAYMIVEERNQGQYFPDYAYRHPLFSKGMKIVSDNTVSDFFSSVDSDQINGFLNDWNANRDHKGRIYISYDSANKNNQAGNIDFIEFGKAKVDQGCPIFNLGIAYDQTNQVPLFYENYPGSVNDVSQFKFLVDKAIAFNYRRIGFTVDRGYFSKDNIAYMDEHAFEFVMMMKGCKPLVSGLINELRNTFENRGNGLLRKHYLSGTTVKKKLFPEDTKERYIHVFFSPMKMANERRALDDSILDMENLFEKSIGKEIEFSAPYTDYFNCHYDNKGKFLFAEEKPDAIEKACSMCGYFCIVTSEKMSAAEAYALYSGRDASEKLFATDKSFLGSNSMRVHTKESLSAKIFIEFIALIIRQRIFNLLKEQMLRLPTRQNYMTVPAAIRELEKIELIRINNSNYRLDHAITKTQEIILNSFGITKDQVIRKATVISTLLAK